MVARSERSNPAIRTIVTPIHDWQAKRRTIVLTSAGGLFPHRLCQLYRVDLGGETEHLKHPNPVPVDINFVPLQAVTRRRWVGMMVVVPPFAECQYRDQPVVRRHVMRRESS